VPNPNPTHARLARKRRPKPGTVRQLTAVLWRAITHLETHLERLATAAEVDTSELCKLTHATAQAGGVYLKAIEVGELEARLEAVERAIQGAPPGGWAA
jgi:transcriptional regulator of aromatic amino acid metabolism